MNIKKKIKNSIENDVFVKQIHSEEKEFDGRYFIFIRSFGINQLGDTRWQGYRVKLSKNKHLPNTLEDIEKAEYIQFFVELAMEALDREIVNQEKNLPKQELFPDEYGYVPVFRKHFCLQNRKTTLEDMIYIGNFGVSLPDREYIYDDTRIMTLTFWEDADIELIHDYKMHNRKDPKIYSQESSQKRKEYYKWDKETDDIIKKREKILFEKYGDVIEEYFANEPYTEESLTYVGPEEEREKWEGHE